MDKPAIKSIPSKAARLKPACNLGPDIARVLQEKKFFIAIGRKSLCPDFLAVTTVTKTHFIGYFLEVNHITDEGDISVMVNFGSTLRSDVDKAIVTGNYADFELIASTDVAIDYITNLYFL